MHSQQEANKQDWKTWRAHPNLSPTDFPGLFYTTLLALLFLSPGSCKLPDSSSYKAVDTVISQDSISIKGITFIELSEYIHAINSCKLFQAIPGLKIEEMDELDVFEMHFSRLVDRSDGSNMVFVKCIEKRIGARLHDYSSFDLEAFEIIVGFHVSNLRSYGFASIGPSLMIFDGNVRSLGV
ncbi:MAG: hypothetical protein QNI87_01850 [Erythrobacter sp.]|uniref:hypothetical protein n=1 Tax=Erythrobacter sp. TaxID=1042 RepID=UPI00260B0170|nr:hypothetical protein [Erythrobacter sp.]MDJ0977258.1 hypothetical protein [Erythrobacter sp.]